MASKCESTTSSKPECPPLDGSFLFPDIIDFHMQRNGPLPMYIFPDPQHTGALTYISFLEFGRAAHRVAHAFRPVRTGMDGQVTAILVQTDTLLYTTLIAGLIIAGIIPFPISTRIPPQAVADLLLRTSCRRIASIRPNHTTLLDDIQNLMGNTGNRLAILEIPSLSEVYPHFGRESLTHPFIAYPKRSTHIRISETALYLHSSGSTGFPKPIAHSYRSQLGWMNAPMLWQIRNYPSIRFGVMAIPPFHIFGVSGQLYSMLIGFTGTLYAPTSVLDRLALPPVPTSDNIIECIRQTGTNVIVCVPYHLEQWAESEEALGVLRKLGYVAYGGGPLSEKKGEFLTATGISLAPIYGATEFSSLTVLPPHESIANGNPNWRWIEFSDKYNIRWAPRDPDLYELQVLRSDKLQPSVENLPDVQGFATSDLFIRHPTDKRLWKVVGRMDDIIVLSSGDKAAPSNMEAVITSCPYIEGAVMFGRERSQVGVLVEPTKDHFIDVDDDEQVARFRNQVWPYVEEANASEPIYSRIFKEMILITQREKPMIRSGKGSIQRMTALQSYGEEIDRLYDIVGLSREVGEALPTRWTENELEHWLLSQATKAGSNLSATADLFAQGFDSLRATYLRNRLINSLLRSPEPGVQKVSSLITPSIIFEYPTIKSLARKVAALIQSANESNIMSVRDTHIKAIHAMVQKYSAEFQGLESDCLERPSKQARIDRGRVVLLTGSTGTLGSYLLADLLERWEVSRVYVLNRFSTAPGTYSSRRQTQAFEERGLNTRLLRSGKISYLEGDISQERLGLSVNTYERLKYSLNIIIHNAWRVDFSLSLSSFEPHIRGTRMLLDLALASSNAASLRFIFISSIGSVLGWDPNQGPVPEEHLRDPAVAVNLGYGESKFVAEEIISRSGLQATSLRVGHLAGGSLNGAWPTTDWLPVLVKSSLALGSLLDLAGFVSWIPADRAAAVVLDVALSESRVGPVLNITHPMPVQWRTILEDISDALVSSGQTTLPLPLQPYSEWIRELERRAQDAKECDFKQLPALKILPFLRDFLRPRSAETISCDVEAGIALRFATDKACLLSSTMRHLAVQESEWLGVRHARAWATYWKSKWCASNNV